VVAVTKVLMFRDGSDEFPAPSTNTVKYTNALHLCKQMNVAPQTAILMDVRASCVNTRESEICQQRIRT
jgi:hypothetical protein